MDENERAAEIRKRLRQRTGTALNVRKAGRGDWIDIRGTGPANTFTHTERIVLEPFLAQLGLRMRGDYATLPPQKAAEALILLCADNA